MPQPPPPLACSATCKSMQYLISTEYSVPQTCRHFWVAVRASNSAVKKRKFSTRNHQDPQCGSRNQSDICNQDYGTFDSLPQCLPILISTQLWGLQPGVSWDEIVNDFIIMLLGEKKCTCLNQRQHTDIYITSASCWALQSSSSADACFRDSSSRSRACTLCSARIALCSAKAARSSASSAASWKTSRSLLYRAHSFSSRAHSWLRILHCSASFWLSATCRFKAWAFRHASSCNAGSTCLDDERRISA